MPSKLQTQISLQRRAAYVISEWVLDRASRDGLAALNWSIGNVGVEIVGRSYALPSSKRRKEITAWAEALDIQLSEHTREAVTTVMGVAQDVQTRFGFATIMLICDTYQDENQASQDL